ncbi:hypothetical protein FS837_007579 [Tulasnella sp. UAMH 9824]|nr:hypothetical protein FS837_007579 [Tulasnella sp. UAMH 9824]
MRSPPPFSPQSPTPRCSQQAPDSYPVSTRNISQSLSALSLTSFAAPRAPIQFDDLPPNQDHIGATWLEAHTPFPIGGTTDSVVAALAAFRAAEAYPVWEMLDSSCSADHDPQYYVREKSCRLHMYLLLTSVIKKMCAYLDLTTGASIYLYVCRPEHMNGQGQREVEFRNCLGGEASMRAAHNAIGQAAEVWADLQISGFGQRSGRLDMATRGFRDACTRGGIPIHALGDFPLLARLDGGVADELMEAMSQLNWTSFRLTQPRHTLLDSTAALVQVHSTGQPFNATTSRSHNDEPAPCNPASISSFLHYRGYLDIDHTVHTFEYDKLRSRCDVSPSIVDVLLAQAHAVAYEDHRTLMSNVIVFPTSFGRSLLASLPNDDPAVSSREAITPALQAVAAYPARRIWRSSTLLIPFQHSYQWILVAVTNLVEAVSRDFVGPRLHDVLQGEAKPDRNRFTILVLSSSRLVKSKSLIQIAQHVKVFLNLSWEQLHGTKLEFVDIFLVKCPEQEESGWQRIFGKLRRGVRSITPRASLELFEAAVMRGPSYRRLKVQVLDQESRASAE